VKTYLRILQYVRKYPGYIAGFAVSVVLMAVFGGVSLALLDPIMNLLFSENNVQASSDVSVNLNIHDIKDVAYYFVNDIIKANGKKQALLTFIIIVVSLNILGNIFRYGSNAFSAMLRTSAIHNFRADLMDSLIAKNIAFIDKQRKGDLITRVTVDVDEVDRSIVSSLNAIFKNPVQIGLYLAFLLQYSAALTGVIFIVLPVSAIFISTIGRSLKKNAHDGQTALANR